MLTDLDLYLVREGTHFRAYERFGAHPTTSGSVPGKARAGTNFTVWAPNAASVSVVGSFNDWRRDAHPMESRGDESGIWHVFVPDVGHGDLYKFHIVSRYGDYRVDKSDPYAFRCETPPLTASVVWDLSYDWGDARWMKERAKANSLAAPWAVYEVHLGSWRRVVEDGNRSLSYREMAHALADYVVENGFTHVELLPVSEHPFYGSWGYQVTGYFAPTSRYGTPQDFMYLVDHLHQRGIGIILDWVPSHFPADEHGLAYFDGTHLYEHADPRQGFHPEWGSSIFNYGRAEVRSFLGSSALFWLKTYHIDALRVDAVASMLYLDYAREAGEWIPNRYGGNENLEAVAFLKSLNEAVYRDHPDVQTIAEESTAWPMVSRPAYLGGLGFGLKWNMGWMHDTLNYMKNNPIHRRYHHDKLTFSICYAFSENFMLPMSHDEVVHGKGSLIGKMPGNEWQQFANLRLMYGYMWAHPGKKLLFMGGEFGQRREWQHEESLEWHVLDYPLHAGLQRWVRDLNTLLRGSPALHERDFGFEGFEWVDCSDVEASVITFLRKAADHRDVILVVCNFTPVPRSNYTVGVPEGGRWTERLNSDAPLYGGSGAGNFGGIEAAPLPAHGRTHSLMLQLPPLSVLYFAPDLEHHP
ncbi:MAG: 1,4-alpha-glucan branching protein GlgB [Chromatiales bacterium]|jgi:1,4-alpha-glucan branching enzyme|nr:MAG: 1,4-alpha-glucan branching protein GlgB [Chromatiales bacterium]